MKKIFIVGNSRSGTTMLGRMLNQAGQIHTFGELHFFEQLVSRNELAGSRSGDYERVLKVVQLLLIRSRLGFFAKYDKGIFIEEAKEILNASHSLKFLDIYEAFLDSETKKAGKSVACEQTPRYLFSADLILERMPDAYVINLIRDPRDVVISQKNKWKRRFKGGASIPLKEAIRSWGNFHPFMVAKIWKANVRFSDLITSERFRTIYFEDLVTKPSETVSEICQFVGEQYYEDMLRVPIIGSSNHVDTNTEMGVDKTRAGGWRNKHINRGTRELVEFVCKTEMEKHRYTELLRDGNITVRAIFHFWSLPLKILLGIFLNLNRYKDIKSAYTQRFARREGV